MRISFIALLATIFLVPILSVHATKAPRPMHRMKMYHATRHHHYKYRSTAICIKPQSAFESALHLVADCSDTYSSLNAESIPDIVTFLNEHLTQACTQVKRTHAFYVDLCKKGVHATALKHEATLRSGLGYLETIKAEIEAQLERATRGGLMAAAGARHGRRRPITDRELQEF